MIIELQVSNFAIIEDVNVKFNKGMTSITGGTGAGKSLIIDSIALLLGSRADADLIRYGSTKASILGIFSNTDKVIDVLKKEGIPLKDNLIILREIFLDSKNTIKVNDVNVTLLTLKKIANKLADIHIQNDTLRLINPENYLELLDNFGKEGLDELVNDYELNLLNYKESLKKYKEALNKSNMLNEKIDLLKYQYAEITALNLEPNEDLILENQVKNLENYDKIYNNLNKSYETLDNEYFSIDAIYEAANFLNHISEYDDEYKEAKQKLEECFYDIEDIKEKIGNKIRSLDFDPELLNNLQERLQILKTIQKKYQKNINELLEYAKNIKEEIDLCENYDEVINNYLEIINKKYDMTYDAAIKLSNYRKTLASSLEKELILQLQQLELPNSNFKISFEIKQKADPVINIFDENGIDTVDFLISLNKGEPVKPLTKVASGGEMSRIMLAIKTIFLKIQNLSLIVFDEIDTGISGFIASQVAKKMKEISRHTQVLCITHLAQVAGIADYQILITKKEKDGRTITMLNYLSYDERVKELAMMLSGERITSYALENAKELLE